MLAGTRTIRLLIASCRFSTSPTQTSLSSAGSTTDFGDLPLRFEHGAADIAAAHAEFDGDVAFLPFAIDIGGAGGQLDFGDFTERYLDGPVRALRAHCDIANGIEVSAILRR